MTRLRLLPGERELVRLRPSPFAWLGRYLLALGFAGWGLFVHTPLSDAVGFYPREHPIALGILVLVAVPLAPAAVGALLYVKRRRWVRLGLCLAAGAAIGIAAYTPGTTRAINLTVAFGCSLVALVLTDIDRRLRAYHLTNLRVFHGGGLWDHAGWTVHYDSILDLDVRRSPLGRLFGYGAIDPVLGHPPEVAPPTKRRKHAVQAIVDTGQARPSLVGVGRLRAVRFLLESFIKDATSNEYLRADQQTQKRVGEALRALGSANVLRRR